MNPKLFNVARLLRMGWTMEKAIARARESIALARVAKRGGWHPSYVRVSANEFVRCRRIARVLRGA